MGLFDIGGAAGAAAAVGASVYQGQRQDRFQKRALQQQEKLADEAKTAAISQKRANEMAFRRLNQKKPNVAQLLFAADEDSSRGYGETTLTGSSGIDPSRLKLGRTSLLGE